MCGHQASLAADHEQNAPVAEDEDDEDDDVERQEIPDAERLLSRLTLPQNYRGGVCHADRLLEIGVVVKPRPGQAGLRYRHFANDRNS